MSQEPLTQAGSAELSPATLSSNHDVLPAAVLTSRIVHGRVIEETSGTPLADVEVRWLFAPPPARRSETPAATVLGAAATDQDGFFSITANATADAARALCQLSWQPEAHSFLAVGGGSGPDELRMPLTDGPDGTLIAMRATAEPGEEMWRNFADFLATNRLVRADQLIRQLSAPFPDSPTAFWSPAQRAGAIASVQNVLTDNGTLLPLYDQEHLVNLRALREIEVGKAMNQFRTGDQYVQYGGRIADWLAGSYFPSPKSDLELYRDYLRGVWVTAATPMHALLRPSQTTLPMPTPAGLEQQIAGRFHQNFHISDTKARSSHSLLVPILRSILTARSDREGFGVAAAALPTQDGQSDEEYLAKLITSSGVSAAELRNRFRIRFQRPSGDQTSAVELNIEALQGLLADTYQSPPEPFPSDLRGVAEWPLIFAPHAGRAPFFLQYDEWLARQERFYPENVFDIRRALPAFLANFRDRAKAEQVTVHPNVNKNNDYILNEADWHASAAWLERLPAIVDLTHVALTAADKQSFPEAQSLLDAVQGLISEAERLVSSRWRRDRFLWYSPSQNLNPAEEQRVSLKARAARPVRTAGELAAFEQWFDPPHAPRWSGQMGGAADYMEYLERWMARSRTLYVNALPYLQNVLLPYLRATISQSTGDHARAINLLGALSGYPVGIARTASAPGYRTQSGSFNQPLIYEDETLPYTTAVTFDADSGIYDSSPPLSSAPPISKMEQRFFKLAQGESMLSWADELYRTDEPGSIRRARELYKGVVLMHGEDPYIAPVWRRSRDWFSGFGIPLLDPFGPKRTNPVRASQLARARQGLAQIDLGLNVYGYANDMVPVLRFKPLKQAADLFATGAKSTQTDFINYMTRFEQATIEGWQTAAMVKKAEAGAAIAKEQIEIAKGGVAKAQEQVAAVKAQIAAKKKEIEDANGFFSQLGDFFGGMKDSLEGLAKGAKGVMSDDSAASSVSGEQMAGILGKSTGGASAAKDAAAATLGSGAAMTMGFAAFAYYGYTTMQGMEAAIAKRDAELKALQISALAAAEAQVKLKERDVTVASLAKQIADTELDLARALDRYQRDRFLNVDVWNKMAAFAQRALRRYIELGARAGWLAERALSFEQNRDIRVMRFNYYPKAMRGLTGADQLQLDLAELEAHRLQGVRLTTPVKHTLSLARDFPLAFGELKRSGRCTFHTSDSTLQTAYPGTFAYRLRAITVAAHDATGAPPRGILRNLGMSTVSREDGKQPQVLARFQDALPLSEFRLHDDLFVYGLPGETLLQFEGSGFDTDWELEFPPAANARGLRSLSDVLITCDMNASYSQALALKVAADPPPLLERSVAVAASVYDPAGLASLRETTGPARIRFDLSKLALPLQEKDRKVANVAVILVGSTKKVYSAVLEATLPAAVQSNFDITRGVAMSNAGPLLGTNAPLPLNALVGSTVDQVLTLTLERTGVADELSALYDVVLYVDYVAELQV